MDPFGRIDILAMRVFDYFGPTVAEQCGLAGAWPIIRPHVEKKVTALLPAKSIFGGGK